MNRTIWLMITLVLAIVLLVLSLILALGPTEIKYPERLPPGMSVEEATKKIKPTAWICVLIALIMGAIALWQLGFF